MKEKKEYVVNPGWGVLLADAGISSSNVLRHAGLPRDLFRNGQRTISVDQYLALWEGIEERRAARRRPPSRWPGPWRDGLPGIVTNLLTERLRRMEPGQE